LLVVLATIFPPRLLLLLTAMTFDEPTRQHTLRPIVTGTSVLGVTYAGGVMLAADTLLSYGSMAKAQSVSRLKQIDSTLTVIGGSGEYSDFQQVIRTVQQKALEETTTSIMDDLYDTSPGIMNARTVWNYLRMVMYSRRNKGNPLWNELVVAGLDGQGKSFLGTVDKIGTTVQDNFCATGFGTYLAMPLLREKWSPNLTEGEARALLEDCMKVLFYRDCRASSRIQLAKIEEGTGNVLISEPYEVETSWDASSFVQPVADLEGDGGW